MSVTHPLLKELKGHTLQLLESEKPITDDNGEVSEFCECLEKIFSRGVLPLKNAIGFFRSPECWHWLEQVGNEKSGAAYSYISSVESTKKCPKVTSNRGRTRLLIRTTLVRRCLHVPVQIIVNQKRLYAYYKNQYILGDEILVEMFLSILKLLARIEFKLDLNKSRFLDDTWILPDSVYLNLVPCAQLGISVMFVDGKAIVYDIAPYSVAAENDDIKVGDILDDLNEYAITDNVQGALGNIIKKAAGRPINVHIIKAVVEGNLFPPIIPLLSQAGLDPTTVAASYAKSPHLSRMQDSEEVAVTYLGTVGTGDRGDVKEINRAIEKKLCERNPSQAVVIFDYHDLELKVINVKTQEVIVKHSYLEISSCGATTSTPTYFAFIAGDQSYTECKDFKCYIFHCENRSEIENLLRNIAQGFRRTHCAA